MAERSPPFSIVILGHSRIPCLPTQFEIEVTNEAGERHRVYRRYRDFVGLASSFWFRRCASFPRLPPKGVLQKLHPSFMARRVQGLTRFLTSLLEIEAALESDALQAFLQLPLQKCGSLRRKGFSAASTLDAARSTSCGWTLSGIEEFSDGDASEVCPSASRVLSAPSKGQDIFGSEVSIPGS